MATGRLGSRIRAVAPAFPSQGPAFLAQTLAGTTVRMVRRGQEPRIRSKLHAQLQDVPQRELVMTAPFLVARDAAGSPALGPGAVIIPPAGGGAGTTVSPPAGTTPPGSAGGCGCGT